MCTLFSSVQRLNTPHLLSNLEELRAAQCLAPCIAPTHHHGRRPHSRRAATIPRVRPLGQHSPSARTCVTSRKEQPQKGSRRGFIVSETLVLTGWCFTHLVFPPRCHSVLEGFCSDEPPLGAIHPLVCCTSVFTVLHIPG